MCDIQDMVFCLKEGFTDSHKVDVLFNKSGSYIQVIVGNNRLQRIAIQPFNEKEKKCRFCLNVQDKREPTLEELTYRHTNRVIWDQTRALSKNTRTVNYSENTKGTVREC